MNPLHNIEFMLSEDVALRVLYAINENYGTPRMEVDTRADTYFIIELDKERALDLYDRFGWAMIEVCDMDQEDGGSFI